MSLGYDMVYGFVAIITSPLWLYRMCRTGKWRTDWRARFAIGLTRRRATRDARPTLPVHAVSVGEGHATRQPIEQSERDDSLDWRIVLSVTTDTGITQARKLYGDRLEVVRLPFDFGPCVRRFLDHVQPDLLALMELEVWPNLVRECARREVPACIINGRLSDRSFPRYRMIAPFVRSSFARLAGCAMQTAEYAARVIALGARPDVVQVLDTMKWDTARIADDVPGAAELATAMGIDRSRPLIVGSSTSDGEEKLLIDTCPRDAQLLIVPRKPERFEAVARLAPPDEPFVRRSEHADDAGALPSLGKRLFLLDTMGELRKAHALASVIIVGRSFVETGVTGGSDPIEPVALARPTIIGPYHENFREVVRALADAGGIEVTQAPGDAAGELLVNERKARTLAKRGREVVRSRQGATRRHVEFLRRLMPDAEPRRLEPSALRLVE